MAKPPDNYSLNKIYMKLDYSFKISKQIHLKFVVLCSETKTFFYNLQYLPILLTNSPFNKQSITQFTYDRRKELR